MLTNGALKVLQPLGYWGNRDKFLAFATQSNYKAATWNGEIYVLAEVGETKQWVETPFVWDDFDFSFPDVNVVHSKEEEE